MADRMWCHKIQNTSKQSYIIGHKKEINNGTLAFRSHRFAGEVVTLDNLRNNNVLHENLER